MEKRSLLAIAISMLVLILYQYFFMKPAPPKKLPATEQAKEEKKAAPPAPLAPPSALVVKAEVKPATGERTVKVVTDLYTAVFSSKGGVVKQWRLGKFKDKDGLDMSILSDGGHYPALGLGWKEDFSLSTADFNIIGKDLKLDSATPTGSIVFEHINPQYQVRRTYTFHSGRYKVDLKDEVYGLPEYEITLGTDFGFQSPPEKDSPHTGPVLLKDAERIELTPKKLKEIRSYRGGIKWIAQEDKYFFSSIVPISEVDEAKAWKHQDSAVIAFKVKPGVNNFMVYAGPKEIDTLKELNVGLEHIIDFGFFSPVARPLFWILKLFYKVVGNYGWAIIFLTIVVRIPFIPLMNIQQKSMKKLQEIQPRMQEIRQKHKKDPKRMQAEMTELYKKHKVNPASGCLPLLLQIPVFFALYKVLLIAIELRAAPFMLWITDLSQKDPYYVLPILMGVTMFIQQKMTPSAGDPRQQKIMLFMPVILTFLFLSFASGLVLYWLVNNLLSIAQQFYVNIKTKAQAQAK